MEGPFEKVTIVLLLFACIVCCCCDGNPLVFSTSDCFLTEPVYGYKFDFTGLRSDLAHHVLSDKGDTFVYNICGNISRTCAGSKDVAACLTKDNKEHVLGTQHQLHYDNGKMYFSFSNGAKCPNSTGEFQLHVSLGCDYTLDKNQSQVTTYADDACSYYIRLETPLACLPEPDDVKSSTCSVKDEHTGHTFNLSSLNDVNYRTTDRNGSVFVLNICKPVLYGENAMCPQGSSVCYVSLNAADYQKKFFDYGTVQPNPIIENGQLLIRHTSKTSCNATDTYSATIYFYCDINVKNAHPEFIGRHGCEFTFSFVTPLACSSLAPCTAITHGTEIIDMSSLKDKAFTLEKEDTKYTFVICGNAGAPCLDNDGACMSASGQTTSLGLGNSQLLVNDTGAPYLLYNMGAKCQKPNVATASTNTNTNTNANTNGNSNTATTTTTTFWSTKIEFVCANNATKDNGLASNSASVSAGGAAWQPKIIENSNCQLLIQYQTPLACHEQITCKDKTYAVDGGDEMVDLTPLINAAENYEAQINSSTISAQQVGRTTKFFLNVCRPLVPSYGLGCAGGSAACMAKVDGSSATPEEELSLGFPLARLEVFNRTTAELRYFKGGPCPSDPTEQLSSGIQFHCDMRAGRGTPVLQAISDCHYRFTWATNVICPPYVCNFNADTCEIINDEINVSYNLKTAPYTEQGKIKIQKDKIQFTIDVCGTHHKAVTDYSQGLVNLFFTQENSACGADGSTNVQMRLICSDNGEPETTFTTGAECNLLYVKRTPDICKFLGLETPPSITATTMMTTVNPAQDGPAAPTTANSNSNNIGPNNQHPAERTGSVGAILGGILSVTFFVAVAGVLAFSPERRSSLRRLFRRTDSAVRYSRVQSIEEANLLLEQNGEFTDSDDDMLL